MYLNGFNTTQIRVILLSDSSINFVPIIITVIVFKSREFVSYLYKDIHSYK
jgi:hypothetical protein